VIVTVFGVDNVLRAQQLGTAAQQQLGINGFAPADNTPPGSPSSPLEIGPIIGVVVAAVLLFVAVAVFLVRRASSKSSKARQVDAAAVGLNDDYIAMAERGAAAA